MSEFWGNLVLPIREIARKCGINYRPGVGGGGQNCGQILNVIFKNEMDNYFVYLA